MKLHHSASLRGLMLGTACLLVFLLPRHLAAQEGSTSDRPNPAEGLVAQANSPSEPPPQPGQPATAPSDARRQATTAEQLKRQEHQRILGVFPNFNTADLQDAARLTPGQKFRLAFKSATDPATIGIAAIVGGIAQWDDSYKGYGQGAAGYFKRFGASYADTFDGTILGNAAFPVLLHQDPRYFRKGTGSKSSRILYAIESTVRCKNDDGRWVPNYSNVLGNLAAGGISNLYYPSSDRGAGLTVERALTVSAEGALGALFYEFYPDLRRRAHRRNP